MVTFPNCKINLGLHVLEKRSDGYHNLETVFYPVQLRDALELIQKESQSVELSMSGSPVDGQQDDNICIKAYQLLRKDFPDLLPVQIHLHKAIPMGAGLGGGSADGAFTLKLLNKKFSLGLSEKQLADYALQLGSDCPFFIINKPCYASGRGEIFETIKLDLTAFKFFIVYPAIRISTGWAFENIKPAFPRKSIKEIIQQPVESWKEKLINDFEESVFRQYPEIKMIKDELYNAGAVYASMSGSGSAMYGIFKKGNDIKLSFPSNYFIKELHS
jgi:4-diphosphocytidyl-2-C-methyl-D-erythritol kinase